MLPAFAGNPISGFAEIDGGGICGAVEAKLGSCVTKGAAGAPGTLVPGAAAAAPMTPGTELGGGGGLSRPTAKLASACGSGVCPGPALKNAFARWAIRLGSMTLGTWPPC